MLHIETKRTHSVHRIYTQQNSASKPKGSNLLRLHTDKDMTHNSVDTSSAQKTRLTLPELGELRTGAGYTLLSGYCF